MYLNKHEEEMLNGKYGEGVAEAMRIQVALGEAFDAERMLEVTRTHVAFACMESDIWFAELLLSKGALCKISPTSNPFYDASYLEKSVGQKDPPEDADMLYRAQKAFKDLGVTLTYSCTPYMQANVPRFGEITAFSESSATPYVNSVCGARSNRESANSAMAASITGLVPLYGLLKDENRKGEILVKVEVDLKDDFDYRLLGYAASKKMGYGIPVFTGMPLNPKPEELTAFGAELNTGGAVSMYHIVGVTPEAKDLETAFGGKPVQEEIIVTATDLTNCRDSISYPDGKVDFAMFGCPHYNLNQIRQVARLLEGKKIRKDTELWIFTSSLTKELAARSGYMEIINKAGGHIMAGTCPDMSCWYRRYSGKIGITDSPKAAYYTPRRGINFIIKRMQECIEAVLEGGC